MDAIKDITTALGNAGATLQTVNEFIDSAKTILMRNGTMRDDVLENLVTRLEDLLLFSISIAKSTDPLQAVAILLLYVRTHFNGSYISVVKKFIVKILAEMDMRPEWEEIELKVEAGFIPDSASMSIKDHWNVIREGPMSHFVKHLINALVIMGICPDKSENVVLDGVFDLVKFRPPPRKAFTNWIDSVVECIDWTINHLLPAYEHNDLSYLFSSEDWASLDKMYANCLDMVSMFNSGQFERLKKNYGMTTENDVIGYLEMTELALNTSMSSTKDKSLRALLLSRFNTIKKLVNDLFALMHADPLREKPYMVLVYGDTGVGKSTIMTLVNHQICHANGFRCDANSTVHLAEEDKFESEFRPHHITAIVDDACNTRAERLNFSPLSKILKFGNNVHVSAMSAIAENKGQLPVRVKLVIVSTNVKSLMAQYWSVNPASIQRRFEAIMTIENRPEALDSATGMLDTRYVEEFVPDVWKIKVEHIRITRMGSNQPDVATFVPDLVDASVADAIEFLKAKSVLHFSAQKRLVCKSADLLTTELCPLHHWPKSECQVCLGKVSQKILEMNPGYCQLAESCDEKLALIPEAGGDPPTKSQVEEVLGLAKRFYEVTEEFSSLPDDLSPDVEYIPISPPPHERIRMLCESAWDKIVHVPPEVKWGALAAALGTISLLYINFKRLQELVPQGTAPSRPPISEEQPNFWKKVVVPDLSISDASRTTPPERLLPVLWKNLYRAVITVGGSQQWCNVFPVGQNDWIFPLHVFKGHSEVEVHVSSADSSKIGHKQFREIVDTLYVQPLGNSDLAMVRLVRGGDVRDLSKFFPEVAGIEFPTKCHFLRKDYNFQEHSWVSELQPSRQYCVKTVGTYLASEYKPPEMTDTGWCGAIAVSVSKTPSIVGVHTAGSPHKPMGICSMISQEMIAWAREKLGDKYRAHSTGDPRASEYGVDIRLSPDIHFKNPVNFIPDEEDVAFEILGQHSLPQSRFRSDVKVAEWSPIIEKHFGPREHTPPPTDRPYISYNREMRIMGEINAGCRPKILSRALCSMKADFDRFRFEHKDFTKSVCKLSYEDAVNGIDGAPGIDRLDMSTSVGFPINKAKKYFIEEVESDSHAVAYDFKADVLDVRGRVEEMKETLLRGERISTIFRGNLKDEPITQKKWDDHKIRVFAGSQVAFTVLMRMYTLPLMAARKKYPLTFESAVGCNAAGKDWNEFAKFFTWKDRMVNGDFKAFDKRLPPEVMMAVFEYYVYILEIAGFDEEDITIVRGIATEICYPCYEMLGTIIKVSGSNPSGHSLTVEVNNDGNRLVLRYVYYSLHEDEFVPPFSEVVHLLCYGDDNIMSISPEETKMNHTVIAEELAKIGMVYTMADKESESVPFVSLDECEFLKRKFQYDPDVNAIVGPLLESSVYKRLHMFRAKTPLSKPAYLADVLSGAAQEMFLHGKKSFDEFVNRANEIAQEVDKEFDYGFKVCDIMEIPTYEQLLKRYEETDSVMILYPQAGHVPLVPIQPFGEHFPDSDSHFIAIGTTPLAARWGAVLRECISAVIKREADRWYRDLLRRDLVESLNWLFWDVQESSVAEDDFINPPRVGRFKDYYQYARHIRADPDHLVEVLDMEYHRLVIDDEEFPDLYYCSGPFYEMARNYQGDLRARHVLMWYATPIRHLFPKEVAVNIWAYAQPTLISVAGWYFSLE